MFPNSSRERSCLPRPGRTAIYAKMGKFLKLPPRKLSELAGHERTEELKKKLTNSPAPLFKDVRELLLRKCAPGKAREIRSIFERQPFGELERLVTQKLLDVVKRVARRELESEGWLKRVAQLNGRSYEEMRAIVLGFLDVDAFHVSDGALHGVPRAADRFLGHRLEQFRHGDRVEPQAGARLFEEARICGAGIERGF